MAANVNFGAAGPGGGRARLRAALTSGDTTRRRGAPTRRVPPDPGGSHVTKPRYAPRRARRTPALPFYAAAAPIVSSGHGGCPRPRCVRERPSIQSSGRAAPKSPAAPAVGPQGLRARVRVCVLWHGKSCAPAARPRVPPRDPPPPPQPRAGGRGEDIRIAEGAGLPPPPAAGHGGGQSGAGRRCSGARPEGHTARRGHCAAGGRQRGVCVPCRAVPCRTVCVLSSCNFAPARHLGFVIFFFFLPIYLFIRPHFLFSLPFLFLDFFFPPFPPPPFIFSFMFPFHLPFISPCISPRVFSLLLTSPLRGGRARSRRQQPVAGAVTEPHGCRPRRSRRRLLLLLAAAARPGSPRGRDVTKGRAYAPWKLRRLSVPS